MSSSWSDQSSVNHFVVKLMFVHASQHRQSCWAQSGGVLRRNPTCSVVITQRENQSLRRTQRHCAAAVASLSLSLSPHRAKWSCRKRSTCGSRRPTSCATSMRARSLAAPTSCPNSTMVTTHELCGCLLTSGPAHLCMWPVWPLFPFAVNTHLTLTDLWLCALFRVKNELTTRKQCCLL